MKNYFVLLCGVLPPRMQKTIWAHIFMPKVYIITLYSFIINKVNFGVTNQYSWFYLPWTC